MKQMGLGKRTAFGAPLVLLACTGCGHRPQVAPEQEPAVAAQVIQVSDAAMPQTLDMTGVVVARRVADVASQVMAPVREVRVREGERVTKGEVVVRLSSALLAAGVEQAQSQLTAARKQEAAAEAQKGLAAATFARYDKLQQRHSVTPNEFDQVKTQMAAAEAQQQAAAAQVQAAEAAAKQAQATDAYTTITAPFSGVVTAKYVDAGAMAAPGTPLLRIEGGREYEVDVQMNESAVRSVHSGEMVEVQAQGAPAAMQAKILEIVPAADPAAHTVTVKIGLPPSSAVYSGLTAHVAIPVGETRAISVPRSAVRQRGQMDSVLALDGGSVAQIRYVNLGRSMGGRVEVTSGLNAGDRILANPSDALIGRRIEPRT